MQFFYSSNASQANAISIPNDFIEKFVPTAEPLFTAVYIYTLYKCVQNEPCDSISLASVFHSSEDEIDAIWHFWIQQSLAVLKNNRIELTPPSSGKKRVVSTKAPVYSPQELALYQQNDAGVRDIFSSAESYLGRILSQNELSILFSLHDWLGFSFEMIEFMLAYYASTGKASIRYIEQVAINWKKEGIDTLEKARQKVDEPGKDYYYIMKALGISGRNPVAAEINIMKKWLEQFKFSLDIIEEACEKTVLRIGKSSFSYADSILTNWYKNGVKTRADVRRLDEAFASARRPQTVENKPKPQPKTNRFVNYEQRDWDFEELEKKESEYLRRNLKG